MDVKEFPRKPCDFVFNQRALPSPLFAFFYQCTIKGLSWPGPIEERNKSDNQKRKNTRIIHSPIPASHPHQPYDLTGRRTLATNCPITFPVS